MKEQIILYYLEESETPSWHWSLCEDGVPVTRTLQGYDSAEELLESLRNMLNDEEVQIVRGPKPDFTV